MRGGSKKIAVLLIIAVFAVPMIVLVSAHGSEGAGDSDGFTSYYDQLDDNGKAIYDAMNSADPSETTLSIPLPIALSARTDSLEDAVAYLNNIVTNTFNLAFKALNLSSPLAFWTWYSNTVSTPPVLDLSVVNNVATVTAITLTISFANPYTGEVQDIQKMLDDLNAAADKFQTSSTNERDILMDINNYLVNLVTYDPNALVSGKASIYDHGAYGALVDPNHYAVCDGYSGAFTLLCERENIDCVMVLGTALPSLEAHAWNYVKMDDGKWYAMDVTWNDNGKGDNPYFLKGADTFFSDHQQGVYLGIGMNAYPFNSPVINSTAYDKVVVVDYTLYSYLFAVLIMVILCVTLYRYTKKGS